MSLNAPVRFFLFCCISVLLQACASTVRSPEIVNINLVTINKAIVQDTVFDGEFSQEFDVPGFRIIFESDREIAPKESYSKVHDFVFLDYYDCDSSLRYEPDHPYSARDYVKFHQSWAQRIGSKPNGSFIYQAQIIEEHSKKIQNVCAKIFVNDGNIKRKVWRPVFISNEMKLAFNN